VKWRSLRLPESHILVAACLPETLHLLIIDADPALLQLWVRIKYALPVLLLGMLYLLRVKGIHTRKNELSSSLLVGAFLSATGIIVGFQKQWIPTDVIADGVRFVGPIGAAFVARDVFGGKRRDELYEFFENLINAHAIILVISCAKKLYSVTVMGETVVQYASNWIIVAPILLCHALANRVPGRPLVILLAAVQPFLTLSKTVFVATAAALIRSAKLKIGLLVVPVILLNALATPVARESIGEFQIYQRFSSVVDAIKREDSDGSSSARMTESLNAIEIFRRELPLSLMFGLGAGAQWFDVLGIYTSGLQGLNFRETGGAHHIHLTYVALLFRYGLPGLILYILIIHKFYRATRYISRKEKILGQELKLGTSLAFYLTYIVAYSVFDYAIYDTFEFCILLGWALALKQQIKADDNSV
jgi:hypothetical protein